jgi:SHS2 domain-containing protein
MRSAVLAFTGAIVDLASVREVETFGVSCRAAAPDLLLHDLLSELLYLFDARGKLVRDADVAVTRSEDGWLLEARARGEQLDVARHHPMVLVKGVTYHALTVVETGEGWQGTVILDI